MVCIFRQPIKDSEVITVKLLLYSVFFTKSRTIKSYGQIHEKEKTNVETIRVACGDPKA